MRRFALASLAACYALGAGEAPAQDLPEGPGKTVLQTVCTQCHDTSVILAQPRSRDEWAEVIARMIGSGARLNDEEYELVMGYLARHFGPQSHGPAAEDQSTKGSSGNRTK
jgi:hypothetical protein